MRGVWRLQGKVHFKELGHIMFLIIFNETLHVQRVEEGPPWTFDKKLFCLKEYDGSLTTNLVKFCREPILVQMHNIPFTMINRYYGEILGKAIGEIIEVDVDKENAGWALTFRLKSR